MTRFEACSVTPPPRTGVGALRLVWPQRTESDKSVPDNHRSPTMHRRDFLAVAGAAAGAAALGAEPTRETLYNGIELPAVWPPKITATPRDPVAPPYLKSPPAVIPIDVGRQLFVDDFLVAETTLRRAF